MADLHPLDEAFIQHEGIIVAEVGHVVTYACVNNFRSFSTCLANGTWSVPDPCSTWIRSINDVKLTTLSGCPRGYRQFMSANETVELTSDGYDGVGLYQPNQICSWRLVNKYVCNNFHFHFGTNFSSQIAQDNDDRFAVTIEAGDFDLEGSFRCQKDSLLIVSEKRRLFCGRIRKQFHFITTQSHVAFTFKSDADGAGTGFRVSVRGE